jgi:hypothetical protein
MHVSVTGLYHTAGVLCVLPASGLSLAGSGPVDPSRTLVLAVHDAGGVEAPDFQVGGCMRGRGGGCVLLLPDWVLCLPLPHQWRSHFRLHARLLTAATAFSYRLAMLLTPHPASLTRLACWLV